MIARVIRESPFQSHTPKQIANQLDLDIQLVTSIVNRLRSEGVIERIGWGKYIQKREQEFEDTYLIDIIHDMREMASVILGRTSPLDNIQVQDDPFKELMEVYRSIKELGGEAMASNLLRLCAKKSMLRDKVDMLIESFEEVSEQ